MIYYSNIILNTAYCIFFRILNIKKAYLVSKVCPIEAFKYKALYYIIPIPPPAGIAGTSSLIFATADSVVSSVDATELAF